MLKALAPRSVPDGYAFIGLCLENSFFSDCEGSVISLGRNDCGPKTAITIIVPAETQPETWVFAGDRSISIAASLLNVTGNGSRSQGRGNKIKRLETCHKRLNLQTESSFASLQPGSSHLAQA
jgi:hypothetical protein